MVQATDLLYSPGQPMAIGPQAQPEQQNVPTRTVPASTPGGGLAKAWSDWIAKPQNKAAMLNMGVALLQPINVGQSLGGHIGQAVAQGGQAAGRYQKRQQEVQDRQRELAIDEQRAQSQSRTASALEAATLRENRQALPEIQQALLQEALAELGEGFFSSSLSGPENDPTVQAKIIEIMNDPVKMARVVQRAQQLRGLAAGLVSTGPTPQFNVNGAL